MYIYIDESGIFRQPPSDSKNIASVVVALVIPAAHRSIIRKKFRRLTRHWKSRGAEIKGRELDEKQISAVVALLKQYEVILEASFIDLALHTEEQISDFRLHIADGITALLTPEHNATLIAQANTIRDVYRKLSNQLFVEYFLLQIMIPDVLIKTITYYARRIPKELGAFHWIIDAKDKKATEYEKAWSLLLYQSTQTLGLKKPLFQVEGGDYSYFQRFHDDEDETMEMLHRLSGHTRDEIGGISLGMILGEDFRFEQSENDIGLQLADIMANALQRGFNGKLEESGWSEIGALMICKAMNGKPQPISFIKLDDSLKEEKVITIMSPFSYVVDVLASRTKSMFTKTDQLKYGFEDE